MLLLVLWVNKSEFVGASGETMNVEVFVELVVRICF